MKLADAPIWSMRREARKSLVDYVRARYSRQVAGAGRIRAARSPQPRRFFDLDALTLGFARRFATYKRPNLLLRDPDRLLADSSQPAASRAAVHRGQGPSRTTGPART